MECVESRELVFANYWGWFASVDGVQHRILQYVSLLLQSNVEINCEADEREWLWSPVVWICFFVVSCSMTSSLPWYSAVPALMVVSCDLQQILFTSCEPLYTMNNNETTSVGCRIEPMPSAGHVLVTSDLVLYCIVLYCIVLYCVVLYCIVLYCIVLEYTIFSSIIF